MFDTNLKGSIEDNFKFKASVEVNSYFYGMVYFNDPNEEPIIQKKPNKDSSCKAVFKYEGTGEVRKVIERKLAIFTWLKGFKFFTSKESSGLDHSFVEVVNYKWEELLKQISSNCCLNYMESSHSFGITMCEDIEVIRVTINLSVEE